MGWIRCKTRKKIARKGYIGFKGKSLKTTSPKTSSTKKLSQCKEGWSGHG